MFKKLVFLNILVFFLAGCSAKPHCKVVTQIDVISEEKQYHYYSPQKIEKFLYYLRSLETWGPAQLDELEGEEYRITLTFSDGSAKIYRQRGSRCLTINDSSWLKIHTEKGEKLPLLLEAVPSDR